MRRAITAAVAAMLLAGCALPLPIGAPAISAPSALDRADAAFDRLQRAADLVLPLLPIERQVRVRAVMAALALALGAARSAEGSEARGAAISRVDRLTVDLRAALR